MALADAPVMTDGLRTTRQQMIGAIGAPVAAVRQYLFDTYQRTFPRQRQGQSVAIVGIDENSLKAVGQWPWPRNKLAELIDAIAEHRPAAIGLDIYMPESDQTSPEQVARRLGPQHDTLASALRLLPLARCATGRGAARSPDSAGGRRVSVRDAGHDRRHAHFRDDAGRRRSASFPEALPFCPGQSAATAGGNARPRAVVDRTGSRGTAGTPGCSGWRAGHPVTGDGNAARGVQPGAHHRADRCTRRQRSPCGRATDCDPGEWRYLVAFCA